MLFEILAWKSSCRRRNPPCTTMRKLQAELPGRIGSHFRRQISTAHASKPAKPASALHPRASVETLPSATVGPCRARITRRSRIRRDPAVGNWCPIPRTQHCPRHSKLFGRKLRNQRKPKHTQPQHTEYDHPRQLPRSHCFFSRAISRVKLAVADEETSTGFASVENRAITSGLRRSSSIWLSTATAR